VAYHVAFFLVQKALAIYLELYFLALGGRESALKCRRLGFDWAFMARRAATHMARQFTGQ
jgi:hypothetical protein